MVIIKANDHIKKKYNVLILKSIAHMKNNDQSDYILIRCTIIINNTSNIYCTI